MDAGRAVTSMSQVLSTQVVGQCDKLVMVVGHEFITLIVDICVQYGGRETPRCACLLAAAETCLCLCHVIAYFVKRMHVCFLC